jgi:hypothetical protein
MLSRINSGLLVAVAMAVVLLGGEPARAQTYSPTPDGSILIDSTYGSRYIIAGGAKFWIPSSESTYFSNPFFTYYVSTSTLDGITNYPRNGTTVKERNIDSIYVIIGNRAWGIPSMDELQYFGGSSSVHTIPQGSMNYTGFNIAQNGLMVRERTQQAVYVIFGNAKFWVPTESDVQYYGGWENVNVVPDTSTSSVSNTPFCGTRLRERSSGQIYRISIGGKYLIQNPDSYDWANHFVVPDGSLNAFTTVSSYACMT